MLDDVNIKSIIFDQDGRMNQRTAFTAKNNIFHNKNTEKPKAPYHYFQNVNMFKNKLL